MAFIASCPPPTFLTLPIELRLEIYDFVLVRAVTEASTALGTLQHKHISTPATSDILNDVINPALLQCCRQLRSEAWSAHVKSLKVLETRVQLQQMRLAHIIHGQKLLCMPPGVDAKMVSKMQEVLFEASKGLRRVERRVHGSMAGAEGCTAVI